MPAGTPALVALANLTLGSTATSVTFSSISGSYRDLLLVVDHLGSGGDAYTLVQFNNDTSYGSYYFTYLQGNGSSAAGGSSTTSGIIGMYASSTVRALTKMEILDYSATDKHKLVLQRNDRSDTYTEMRLGRWQYNTAITSVKISTSSNSYAAGSTFTLYGIASA